MKKVLSILLAASMLIAMLPNIAFAADANVFTYITNSSVIKDDVTGTINYGNAGIINLKGATIRTTDPAFSENLVYDSWNTTLTSQWALESYVTAGGNIVPNTLNTNGTVKYSGKMMMTVRYSNINNSYLALKLKVEDIGIYDLSIGTVGHTTFPDSDIYFFPKGDNSFKVEDIEGKQSVGTLVAVSVSDGSGTSNNGDYPIGTVCMDERGEYLIVFKFKENSSAVTTKGQQNFYLREIKLTETPASALRISSDNIAVTEGETATITSEVTDSTGAAMAAAKITYTSANDDIAKVSADGVITGVSAGKTTITASVVGYPELDKTISVEVKAAQKVVSAEYVFKPSVLNPEYTANIAFKDYTNPGTYYNTFDTAASARWAWVGMRYFNGYYMDVKTNSAQFSIKKADIPNRIGNAGCAIKIEVPETGIYKSKINYTSKTSIPGMRANVYLVKADTGAYAQFNLTDNGITNAIVRLNDNQLVGEIDTDTGTDEVNIPVNLDREMKLEKGDYYLFFKPTGYKEHPENTTFTSYMLAINSFSITKTGDYTPNTTEADPNVSFGADSNIAAATVTASVGGYVAGNVDDLPRGTEITVTAPAVDGYIFRGWVRGTASGNITNYVSEENSYTFKLVTNTYLTAVYDEIKEVTESDAKVVEFWNEDGKYYTELTAGEDNKLATLPTTPSLIGKVFDKWNISESMELTTDTVLTEAVTRAVAEYDDNTIEGIKFMGESLGDLFYGQSITLSAKEDEKANYWLRDGKVVDFGSSYTYHAWDATDITYSSDFIFWEPIVILDDYANGAFMIEYDVYANGYELVEVGILLNDTPNFNVNSCGAKVTSQRNGNHGQLSVAVDPGTYARGYMIYKEAGVFRIIYSNNVERAE